MSLSIYGIDLAKHSISIHGEDATGKALIHKTISRSKVLVTFVNIPPALIGIEACGASHYWARELTKLGHTVMTIASEKSQLHPSSATFLSLGLLPTNKPLHSLMLPPLIEKVDAIKANESFRGDERKYAPYSAWL